MDGYIERIGIMKTYWIRAPLHRNVSKTRLTISRSPGVFFLPQTTLHFQFSFLGMRDVVVKVVLFRGWVGVHKNLSQMTSTWHFTGLPWKNNPILAPGIIVSRDHLWVWKLWGEIARESPACFSIITIIPFLIQNFSLRVRKNMKYDKLR